jgi:hypothetical protein
MTIKFSEVPGWGLALDPDLTMANIPADADVEIIMLKVANDLDPAYAHDPARVRRYAELYRTRGPWALPPIIVMQGDDMQITGYHRLCAAAAAGLTHIPALEVQQWW